MESPWQELSNATRLDIGSARGGEDSPKLFPIMCVILRKNRIANFEFAYLDSNYLKVGLKNPDSKRTLSLLRNERLRSLTQLCDFCDIFKFFLLIFPYFCYFLTVLNRFLCLSCEFAWQKYIMDFFGPRCDGKHKLF